MKQVSGLVSVHPWISAEMKKLNFSVVAGSPSSEFNGKDAYYEKSYELAIEDFSVEVDVSTNGTTSETVVSVEIVHHGDVEYTKYMKFKTEKQFKVVSDRLHKIVASPKDA